ncbi:MULTISPECIES: ROK family protein [unclassified Arcicella]|uniref:ROK family protein n=1 Tax=unclassified Arcicella TaxID=2644986 RepID=UPI002861CABC|nr:MULTISPECIES: ROK family protein [unclassified Arcicella]MDR6560488.1 glucokinase [Arcicella sp. BE51]MDR6809906.1 glucokinase [Arcicella sp. BE140]MDR6821255.1 glucokinase [Arcicella sp. BE139]
MAAVEYLGIDIGGTNVKMGIVNSETGQISNFYSHDTVSWRKSGHFEDRLGEAIGLQLIDNKNITKVGIGLPGMINSARVTPIEITAIPELNNVPLVEILKKRFPAVDFFLENDANAAALGEFYFGEDRIDESYIFITLGTGVGGAAIIGKKVFSGGRGNAMEPGHTPSVNGKVLERNIGKNELLDLANTMRKEFRGVTQLPDDGTISTTGLVASASEGDALALQVFTKVGELLGENLCHLVAILDINLILIGGGLSASFDYILPSITSTMERWLTKYHADGLTIKRATLGNDAGLLGAASLCF